MLLHCVSKCMFCSLFCIIEWWTASGQNWSNHLRACTCRQGQMSTAAGLSDTSSTACLSDKAARPHQGQEITDQQEITAGQLNGKRHHRPLHHCHRHLYCQCPQPSFFMRSNFNASCHLNVKTNSKSPSLLENTIVNSAMIICIQETAHWLLFKILKCFFCTTRAKTDLYLFAWGTVNISEGWLSFKQNKRMKNPPQLPLFSGLRRQIKVETRAHRHGDDSGAFSLFHILASEKRAWTSWGLLVCRGLWFSPRCILWRSCLVCCYFIIHLCSYAGPRNRINSQAAMLLHTTNYRFFTCLFCYFKIMSIWHVKVCAYSQKTNIIIDISYWTKTKHHRHHRSYNWNLSQTQLHIS